jgi:hypothetical protein
LLPRKNDYIHVAQRRSTFLTGTVVTSIFLLKNLATLTQLVSFRL